MLTKEERAEIAERVRKASVTDRYGVYQAVTGKSVLDCSPAPATIHDMSRVILDLCDTSNMVELPLDKDGEVIHVGDVVYAGDREFTVDGFIFNDSGVIVRAIHTKLSALNFCEPDELTHKKPVTIESLVERFRHVLNKGHMAPWTMAELINIADQLESLGDSDD